VSESSDKGVALEDYIAKTLRRKLGARVSRDKRSGAGSHQKLDINDFFMETPFDIEAKNQKKIAVLDWMRQAKSGASLSRIPTVVFQGDDDVLACIPFENLVDMAVEIRDLKAEIADLRRPIVLSVDEAVDKAVSLKMSAGVSECRNGHIVSPGSAKCLAKGCQYSSSYKAKKVKK